jgi:simple sugar transport system ATP-binding protein
MSARIDHRAPLLEAKGLEKSYGRVRALAGADFELYPGEIHALIGDNGAGKSTLIKCLSGAVQPDAGRISLEGTEVRFANPRAAQELGIETVYQDLSLADALNAADNVYLGRERLRNGMLGMLRFVDRRAMREECERQLGELGIELKSIQVPVASLSGGQRQAVAVARSGVWGRRLLIMDEPVAALAPRQAEQVFELMRRVRDARGLAIIFVSHNLPHVFEVADRVSVMRLGRRVHVGAAEEETNESLLAAMTGVSDAEAAAHAEGRAE